MPDWLIHLVRLTVFSTEVIEPSERYWTLATGQAEAENRTSGGGGRQYSGHILGGIAQLAFLGNRVDFVLSVDAEAVQPGEAPTVGPSRALLPEFVRMATEFLTGLNFSVNRLALGGQYYLPADSRQSSYKNIAKLTKSINVDPHRAREMIFRINWPVGSGIETGMMLNRMTTFNAVMFGQMMVQNNLGQVTIAPTSSDNIVYVTSLELDHNTPAEHVRPFEKDQLLPIFNELLQLTSENLKSGEIP